MVVCEFGLYLVHFHFSINEVMKTNKTNNMETKKINVIFGSNIKHVLVSGGLLKKSILKEYYPAGATLTYKRNNEMFLLNTDDDNIFIISDIDDYYIDIRTTVEDVGPSSTTNADLVKRQKINQCLAKIRKNVESTDSGTKQNISKITDLRDAKSKFCTQQYQSKTVYIGWKHRFDTNRKYKHQKGEAGGSKEFVLDTNIAYTVEDILQMGIKAFSHPVAVNKLSTSECKLGLFNEIIIDKFVLPDDTPCSIWDFFKTNFPKVSRMNLYVLSTRICCSDEENDFEDETLNSIESDNKEKSPKRALENITNKFGTTLKETESSHRSSDTNLIPKKRSENSLNDVNVPQKIMKQFENASGSGSQQLLKVETKNDSSLQPVQLVAPTDNGEKLSITVNTEKVPSFADSGIQCLVDAVYSLDNETPVLCEQEIQEKIIRHNYNKIKILYFHVTYSKYSNEVCIREIDSNDLYSSIAATENEINVDENNFQPIDHGFPISSVFFNGKQIFQLIMDDSLISQYVYPAIADISTDENHTIIYDIDIFIGYNNDKFGIGVLPKCDESCHPIVSWFEDDIIVKKAEMLIWLENVSIDHKWHCEVECSTGKKMRSKNIKISEDQQIYFQLNPIEVMEISKNEFTLTEKIGKGQQGVVYQGRFNNEDVAVKVLKIYSKKTDRVEKEIKALNSVNHENFIKLIAVCKEVKKISLITNYFPSEKLSDLIFDDELKEKFGGLNNSSKNCIALQICRAITYLHNRLEPIIHCDIKPDNILINEDKLIKICDFGLSKFNTEVTVLNSNTVGTGAGIVGTLSYIAPEILINGASANTRSDIWSTACTLVELFNEELIWDADPHDLKEKLRRQELPNLCNIPDLIKPLLVDCFSYNPENRPDLVNLYNVLNN